MWWRTRHGRGPPARHHLLEQLPGPAEHPCRVPLAAAHTPGTAPFPRSGLNTHERSGEEPFKRSNQAQNPRSHTAPASLQRSRTQVKECQRFANCAVGLPETGRPSFAWAKGKGRSMSVTFVPARRAPRLPRSRGRRTEATMATGDGEHFAVVVYREAGRWSAGLLPERLADNLDALLAALRQQPGEGGPIGLVNVADEFFVAVRVVPGQPRILLSDVTAAADWDLARQAVDRLGVPAPSDDDLDDVRPVGDMSIFADMGLDEMELGAIL